MFSRFKNQQIDPCGKLRKALFSLAFVSFLALSLGGCAEYDVPGARTVNVPQPSAPKDRAETINQSSNAIQYLELGEDVLRPRVTLEDDLPDAEVGPYELRSETLAAALQLILADFDIPLAFETELGMSRRVTIANLKGDLSRVIARVCGLVDLYCSYEDGLMVVKERETFAVTLPPINQQLYSDIATGLRAITGGNVTLDNATRTILFTASHRTAEQAKYYFERLRSNTALIIFETNIWEVILSAENNNGINWESFTASTGNFIFDLSKASSNITGAMGLGLNFSSNSFTIDSVVQFLSSQGAVKTISQPQITLLSGSEASLNIGGARDYVSEITRSESASADNLSITTSTIETGIDLSITGYLDDSTVYGNLEISIRDLVDIREVAAGGTQIQLPETSDRTIRTQIRVRPGDALLIGGIVTERDDVQSSGLGFMKPFLKFRQETGVKNTELVFLLRPRVIVYGSKPEPRQSRQRHTRRQAETRRVADVPVKDQIQEVAQIEDLPIEAQRVVEKTIIQPIIADVRPDMSEITSIISGEINAARGDISATRNEVNATRHDVHAARSDVQVTSSRVDGLSSSVEGLKSEIDVLRSVAATNQREMQRDTILQEKILVQLSLLGDRIGLLENNIDEKNLSQRQSLNSQLEVTQSNIDELNRKLASLEGQKTEERARYLDLKKQSEDQMAMLRGQVQELESRAQSAEADAERARKEFQAMSQTKQQLNEQEMEDLRKHISLLEQRATSSEIEANKMRVLAALEAEKAQKISREMQRVQLEADNRLKEALSLQETKPVVDPVAVSSVKVEEGPNPSAPNSLNEYLQGISLESLAPKGN